MEQARILSVDIETMAARIKKGVISSAVKEAVGDLN
jgi:hypothetical protein